MEFNKRNSLSIEPLEQSQASQPIQYASQENWTHPLSFSPSFHFLLLTCSQVTSSRFYSLLLPGDSRAFKNKTQHINRSSLYRMTQLPRDSLKNLLSPQLTSATSARKTAQSHCKGDIRISTITSFPLLVRINSLTLFCFSLLN